MATNREEDGKGRWRQKGKVDFQGDATKREGGFSEWWRHIGRVDYQWGATKREGGFEGVTTEREDGEFEGSDRKGRWSFEIVRQIGRFLSIMKDIYIIGNKRGSDRDGIAKRVV